MRQEASNPTPIAKANEVKRRSFERHETSAHVILHSRSHFQSVAIFDISRGGIKLENAFGLMPGDAVTIELLPRRYLRGKVAWFVAPFCGVVFDNPLVEHDPLLARSRMARRLPSL
jgi:hypothetical protein